MFFIKNISVLLLGGLIGGLLGLVILNLGVLFDMPSESVFLNVLFTGVVSSPVRLFYMFTILLVFVILGVISSYNLRMKKLFTQQTTQLQATFEASKTKDEFISMVLHHLRTPLSGMRWSLKEILEEKVDASEQRQKLQRLYKENNRALGAVEHLIEASQASMDRIRYHFEILPLKDLLEIIKNSITSLESQAKEKNLSLKIEMQPPSKNSVRIDKEKIETSIQALLENAILYTKEGGSIGITSEEEKSYFFFHITDTGMGIPEHDKSKMFLQFFRSEDARRLEPSGFGIGLYLVKTFLKRHHGDIWFVSKKGKGTTFSFKLPIIRAPTEELLEEIT